MSIQQQQISDIRQGTAKLHEAVELLESIPQAAAIRRLCYLALEFSELVENDLAREVSTQQ